jgi:hypothetical protein
MPKLAPFVRRTAPLAAASAVAIVGHAQELRPAPGFWMRFGGTMRTGYSVRFSDTAPPAPGGAGQFGNGFVLPSISGTNAPYTWNWGYNDAGQVQGNSLVLERFDTRPRVGGLDGGSGSTFGGELRAGFEAVRFEWRDRELRFGFEGGYSMGMLSANAAGTATGGATFTRGTYSLLGPGGTPILAPSAPYAGSFNGPGPLIPLNPLSVETITSAGAVSQTQMGLNATLHTIRVGPYLEAPLGRKWLAGFGFGYNTVLPDAELQIRERTTYPGTTLGATEVTSTARKADWRPGGYAELRLQYEFNRRLSAFAAGEFQVNQDALLGAEGRQVRIQMGTVYGGSLGVRLAF